MHRGGWGQSPMNQNGWQGHQHMMQMMQANNEFEFLSLMIHHHEEAIATAQRVLEYSDRPEMREFAQNIIDVQTAEIGQMETGWMSGIPVRKLTSPTRPGCATSASLKARSWIKRF
jgi:uncharacterized protein (DUF305 family)